ncbi:hypothetical protein MTBSS4_350029 [Magnetospirillum sp. SS-4]|nr:hypothetical protein MTBSS4_350029 [Magnetospirillum sp. SS-4]
MFISDRQCVVNMFLMCIFCDATFGVLTSSYKLSIYKNLHSRKSDSFIDHQKLFAFKAL